MSAAATRKRRNRPAALVSHERWLVSYADFMTLLFALFVVLFAASRHNSGALGTLSSAIHSGFSGGGLAPHAPDRTPAMGPAAAMNHGGCAGQAAPSLVGQGQLADELSAVLGESIRRHEVSLQQTPAGLVVSFQELGFFHSGEAGLLPGQAAKIVQAGVILQRHGVELRVEGHSDDQPIHNEVFASNWELSAARAMTVLLLLVDQAHYTPTRLAMAGYGPYRPVADNATAEGRQKNRRVDLVILNGDSDGSQTKIPAPGR